MELLPNNVVPTSTIIDYFTKNKMDSVIDCLKNYPECLFSNNVIVVENPQDKVLLLAFIRVYGLRWSIIIDVSCILHKYLNKINHNFIYLYHKDQRFNKNLKLEPYYNFNKIFEISPNMLNRASTFADNSSGGSAPLQYILSEAPINYKKPLLMILFDLLLKTYPNKVYITRLLRSFFKIRDFNTIWETYRTEINDTLRQLSTEKIANFNLDLYYSNIGTNEYNLPYSQDYFKWNVKTMLERCIRYRPETFKKSVLANYLVEFNKTSTNNFVYVWPTTKSLSWDIETILADTIGEYIYVENIAPQYKFGYLCDAVKDYKDNINNLGIIEYFIFRLVNQDVTKA